MSRLVVNCAKTYNLAADKLGRLYSSPVFDPKNWPTPMDLEIADQVYASAIFSWDLPRLRQLVADATWRGCEVHIGGPAVTHNAAALQDLGATVGYVHDAEDIPGDYPMTWTSRGCIRNCPWCIVPRIEGRTMQEKTDLSYAPLILDNNFLACTLPHIERVCKTWAGRKVDWNQGLDARLYEPSFRRLVEAHDLRPISWRFAYDSGGVGRHVQRAVEDLAQAGVRHERIRVYLLFNFNESIDEAVSRAQEIIAWGASPFPMAYRPLDWESEDYYVAPGWTRRQIIDFRRFFSRAQLWRSTDWNDYKPRKAAAA